MLYTLCQRLIESDRIGFEYGYMGAAEYEFGATMEARKALDSAIKLVRVRSTVKTRDGEYSCVFILDEKNQSKATELLAALKEGSYRNKGAMVERGLQGWLILDTVPALVHMDTEDGAERARKFLDHGRKLIAERSK